VPGTEPVDVEDGFMIILSNESIELAVTQAELRIEMRIETFIHAHLLCEQFR